MGQRMATHLLGENQRLVVYNRTKAKDGAHLNTGAHWASTPKAAALEADVVRSVVSNDEVSRAVWLDPE